MALTYKAPNYDENKYRKGISTKFYTNAIDTYNAQAEKDRQTQLGEAKKNQQSALKQAYIARVQNQNQVNNAMATAGIRGGATETANLNIANQYGNARASANADYTNSVNAINQAIDKNKADYRMDMLSRAEEYRQNMAQARWQADREDSLNEYNAAVEYQYNRFMDKYSGWSSSKKLKEERKKVQKLLKKAKTQSQRIKLTQRIRGIDNRLGALAANKQEKAMMKYQNSLK